MSPRLNLGRDPGKRLQGRGTGLHSRPNSREQKEAELVEVKQKKLETLQYFIT